MAVGVSIVNVKQPGQCLLCIYITVSGILMKINPLIRLTSMESENIKQFISSSPEACSIDMD